jgi:O-methyltransferase
MSDLSLAEFILQHVKAGGRLLDALRQIGPVNVGGERYDTSVVGPFAMPWTHDQMFKAIYSQADAIERGAWGGYGVEPRAYILLKMAEVALQCQTGDFVECGVFRGGTALLAADVFKKANATGKFHLFDTFSGVPDENLTPEERAAAIGGSFQEVSVEETSQNLQKFSDFVVFHPGFVPDTFVGAGINEVRYAHVDINTGQATLDCLEYLVPRLVDGAVMILDDYGWPAYVDCKLVTDTYFAEQGLPGPIPLHTGQAIYFHRRDAERILNF